MGSLAPALILQRLVMREDSCMNDILTIILEMTEIEPMTFHDARKRLKDIGDIIRAEVKAEAACDNSILDYEYEDHPGTWFFRMRERLACWITP